MFKDKLSDYIKSNMQRMHMTFADLQRVSGVPDSSLHSYVKGTIAKPNRDNLCRIAAAFGDGPEVIDQMWRDSVSVEVVENKLIAAADDQERMEKLAELIRSSMASQLDELRASFAAQQTEIMRHADARIEEERQRFKERTEVASSQCNDEIERERAHNRELLALKDELISTIQDERGKVRTYLKHIIRNLAIALVIVSVLAFIGLSLLGGYAVYAYETFDREDPTRGLYRAAVAPEPAATPDSAYVQ